MKRVLGVLIALAVTATAVAGDDPVDRDPYEVVNRAIYSFNDTLDRFILKPVAQSYQAVAPAPVEKGVSNFFSNLGEITNIVNDLLQLKAEQAANDTGRFLVNSTVGVAGLIDVADDIGLEKSDGEDFGQTLGKWGVGSGPFLVIPFLGPSTLRDAPSRFVDSYTNPIRYVDHAPTRNNLYGGNVVSDREKLLAAESLAKGDRYLFIREAYLQHRDFLVEDGKVEDDFGSYEDF